MSRSYLMCRPEYFTVSYAINAWMDTSVDVNTKIAIEQWEKLRDAYLFAGHEVHSLEPIAGLPDMVFAANGAFSIDGLVYGAKFAHEERVPEAAAHRSWYLANGLNFIEPTFINEGEGDFSYVPDRQLILAGYGFRTEHRAHMELSKVFDKEVISLQLIDDRFYHLDVALFVLNDSNVCYFPGAFAQDSQELLHSLFPNAVIATERDALAFGLNAVSDGENVFIAEDAIDLADVLEEQRFNVVKLDLSELVKGGGNIKCCSAELRL